uniref:F-box domain-containing protein n=1 Tax=Strigamia maritima TaxID=126957 RepID=T1IW22_STRMM
MPFIGQDWRSPGEEWVKTDEGWERKKLLERLRRNARQTFELENNLNNDKIDDILCASDETKLNDGDEFWQPFCPITLKCTREIAGFNGLSEAFKRLDFRNAVRDIRRFNYICKLLHLLITQNLTMLSGCAQKVLFNMLEEVAFQVSDNKTNIHILQKLLSDLQKTLFEYYCWGRPLGSTQLWEHHRQTIHRIDSIAKCIVIKEPADSIYPKLQDLPEELIREIMLRLSDHTDLQNGGKAYNLMQELLGEQRIWRELCRFHFSPQQIRCVRRSSTITLKKIEMQQALGHNEHDLRDDGHSSDGEVTANDDDDAIFKLESIDWEDTYHKLRRAYGLREEYAEILQLCRHCRCLFWKSFGHPCIERTVNDLDLVDKKALYVPISPQAFLKFFSL